MGGMVAAIERGYPQAEIAESAYRSQRAIDAREQLIVGVNEGVSDETHADANPVYRRVGGAPTAVETRRDP